ncbi:MAG: DUF6429 family protein [Phycisphaerae bacterium]|jgi:hypothetical protein
MEYDKDKVDELTLALMYLVSFRDDPATRAWKGFDWDALDRLCDKGYISDPKGKARSVVMSEEGAQLSKELFWKHFGVRDRSAPEQA